MPHRLRRVREKGIYLCNKSDLTRLQQLLWIRLVPVSQQRRLRFTTCLRIGMVREFADATNSVNTSLPCLRTHVLHVTTDPRYACSFALGVQHLRFMWSCCIIASMSIPRSDSCACTYTYMKQLFLDTCYK